MTFGKVKPKKPKQDWDGNTQALIKANKISLALHTWF